MQIFVLIMGLFLAIMISSWISIRANIQKTTQKSVPTLAVSTTQENFPAATNKKMYWDLVKEEDRAGIAGDYEQCKRIIAKRYGVSVSEVARIQVEGVDNRWSMPKDPDY